MQSIFHRENYLTSPTILTCTFMSVKALNKPDKPSVAIVNINKVITILNTVKANKLIGKLTIKDVYLCKNKTLLPRRKDEYSKAYAKKMQEKRDPLIDEEVLIWKELESLTKNLESLYQDATVEFRVNFYPEFIQ